MLEPQHNACIAEASRADGVGTCPRCGVTSIRTSVAGEVRVLDGRVLRDSPPCRWGEPCITMLARCKRCDAETANVQREGAPWACDECGAVRHTLPAGARPVTP